MEGDFRFRFLCIILFVFSEQLLKQCQVSRKKTRVKHITRLSVGDAICYRRKGYKHHAIVIESKHDKTYKVIHLTGNSHFSSNSLLSKGPKAKVMEEEKTFSKRAKIYKYTYSYSRHDGKKPEDVAKAICDKGLPKEGGYHFLDFNCEHFVSYCLTGVPFSGQSKQVGNNGINSRMQTCLDNIIKIYVDEEDHN